jgi:hypothetical protein
MCQCESDNETNKNDIQALRDKINDLEDVVVELREAIIALERGAKEPTVLEKKLTKKPPVCHTCSDTHHCYSNQFGREIMCTACPIPCQYCRKDGIGPYCEVTPCTCKCHVKKE